MQSKAVTRPALLTLKKRNTQPPSVGGTSGSEINNETSPGKARRSFSLLPFTPAVAGQPKGHPGIPVSAPTSRPKPCWSLQGRSTTAQGSLPGDGRSAVC